MENSGNFFGKSRNNKQVRLICSRGSAYIYIYITRSIDFFNRVLHLRSPFLAIRKCETPPHAIAGGCIWSHEEHRFLHVTYVTTQVYKGIVARAEKERESFCEPTTHQCTIHFSLPWFPRTANEQINYIYMEYMYRDDEGTGRKRDSKSKGSIKSCRCVSRVQQRDRCQKGLPRDYIGEAVRMESHFAHPPSHKADTTVLSSKIYKFCPAVWRNAGEMSPRA